jgi:hypothetical protein
MADKAEGQKEVSGPDSYPAILVDSQDAKTTQTLVFRCERAETVVLRQDSLEGLGSPTPGKNSSIQMVHQWGQDPARRW